MKIFYISKYAYTPLTGDEDRKFMLSKYMNKIQGNKVTLIYSRANGNKYKKFFGLYKTDIVDNIECVMLNGFALKQLTADMKRMISWLQFEFNLFLYFILLKKSKRPEVVIASSFSHFTLFTAAILKKMYGFQLLVEVRDPCPQTELAFGRMKETDLSYKVFKFIEIFGYKYADKIISTFPKFDDLLAENGFPNKPFLYLPQGFDKDNPSFIKQNGETKPTKENDLFTVTYAGAIGATNMVHRLCEAADNLKDKPIQFKIYGNGPYKEELEKKYAYLPKLHFMGHVPKQQIFSKLKEADLLISIHLGTWVYKYGSSFQKWITYMLAAKPILTAFNGYRHLIDEAECGWFVDAENPNELSEKILEVSKINVEDRKIIGENGRSYALKNHNFEVLAQRLFNFIKI